MTAKIQCTQQISTKSINQEEKNVFTLTECQERIYDAAASCSAPFPRHLHRGFDGRGNHFTDFIKSDYLITSNTTNDFKGGHM